MALARCSRHVSVGVALLCVVVEGHGRLTVPRARNGGENGAVAGGPGSVHSFDESGHAKYQHGICGNAAGTPQSYNRVGEVQATYASGGVAEFKVAITAHHVGYFEFELCADAGSLSEECFTRHRLLKAGCQCSCPGDATHSCTDCDGCRRWWKPLLEGELSQVVTSGYSGPRLPGQGNLVPYEYTLRYVIPVSLKTSRAVLRWHYMTTNSCTSKSSAPEEFWNCADIAIADSAGDVGADLVFDNEALAALPVENLIPLITSGRLLGVSAICPEDPSGNLQGVAAGTEYTCGPSVGGVYAYCKDLRAGGGGGGGGALDCTSPPASGVLCEHQCSDGWFQCANGVAYTKYVPPGTKCRDNSFVLEAECAGTQPQAPSTSPAPTPAPTPTPAASTAAPTLAPTLAPTAAPTPAPTAAPTSSTPTTPAPTPSPGGGGGCGSCAGCLWSSGVCYTDVDASYCGFWSQNTWCGGARLLQEAHAAQPVWP